MQGRDAESLYLNISPACSRALGSEAMHRPCTSPREAHFEMQQDADVTG